MRRWVVMGAMPVEIGRTRDALGLPHTTRWGDTPVHCGETPGGDLVIVFATGVGKVRASAATQYAIDRFDPTHVVFAGAAGALRTGLPPGRVVIADRVVEYDFDDRALARDPDKPVRAWPTDQALGTELAGAALAATGQACHHGTVLTGDRIVFDASERDRLRRAFGGDCVEMEGAAVAATSTHLGVPFSVLRVVSDSADKTSPTAFPEMLSRVGALVARVVSHAVLKGGARERTARAVIPGSAATAGRPR